MSFIIKVKMMFYYYVSTQKKLLISLKKYIKGFAVLTNQVEKCG